MGSYEALDIFGNKMTNEAEREALHKIIQLVGKTHWSGKYKDLKNDCYYVPDVQMTEKFAHINKLSFEEWYKVIEMGINKCGAYFICMLRIFLFCFPLHVQIKEGPSSSEY